MGLLLLRVPWGSGKETRLALWQPRSAGLMGTHRFLVQAVGMGRVSGRGWGVTALGARNSASPRPGADTGQLCSHSLSHRPAWRHRCGLGWKEGPGWVSRSLLQGEPTGPSKQTEPARVLFCGLSQRSAITFLMFHPNPLTCVPLPFSPGALDRSIHPPSHSGTLCLQSPRHHLHPTRLGHPLVLTFLSFLGLL